MRSFCQRLNDQIDDAPWHDDALFDCLPVKKLLHLWFGHNDLFNHILIGVAWHGNFCPPLAVNLNGQRNLVSNQRLCVSLGLIGLRDQSGAAEQSPATLGQMRHHRREQMHQMQ